jgi:hypothetical protein
VLNGIAMYNMPPCKMSIVKSARRIIKQRSITGLLLLLLPAPFGLLTGDVEERDWIQIWLRRLTSEEISSPGKQNGRCFFRYVLCKKRGRYETELFVSSHHCHMEYYEIPTFVQRNGHVYIPNIILCTFIINDIDVISKIRPHVWLLCIRERLLW